MFFFSSELMNEWPSWWFLLFIEPHQIQFRGESTRYIQLWGNEWHLLFPCFRLLGNLSNYAACQERKWHPETPCFRSSWPRQVYRCLSVAPPHRAGDDVPCWRLLGLLLLPRIWSSPPDVRDDRKWPTAAQDSGALYRSLCVNQPYLK